MNELDKLRAKLDDAKIPYEYICKEYSQKEIDRYPDLFSRGNNRYRRNQIIYGRYDDDRGEYNMYPWKFDAICQYGSYGQRYGLIETYGTLGVDEDDDPRVMNSADAFKIIFEDWHKNNCIISS